MRRPFIPLLTWGLLALAMSAVAQEFDDFSTQGINGGAIGSGHDDFSTPGINEGAW